MKKGEPTDLNLWVLAKAFEAGDRIPNRIAPTEAPHLRRCMRAGLLREEGADLVLTAAGWLYLRTPGGAATLDS